MTCATGRLKHKYTKKLEELNDKQLESARAVNDMASAIRKKKNAEGPHNRMWRRLIKQELSKRGLRT
jgi:hypothetical protein